MPKRRRGLLWPSLRFGGEEVQNVLGHLLPSLVYAIAQASERSEIP
jgi:hypothetical protein